MRKLFSVALVLLVCLTTVFAGCTKTQNTPKSAEVHYAKTVWDYDTTSHWQVCGDKDCGLVVNINNYYAQKEYVEKLTNEGWLPLRANTPDKYAVEFGFENFNAYLAVWNNGRAPHLFMTSGVNAGKCICGAEA